MKKSSQAFSLVLAMVVVLTTVTIPTYLRGGLVGSMRAEAAPASSSALVETSTLPEQGNNFSAQTYRMDKVNDFSSSQAAGAESDLTPHGKVGAHLITFERALNTDVTVMGVTWDTTESDVRVFYRFLVKGKWLPWNHANHGKADQGSEREGQEFTSRGGTEAVGMTDASQVQVKLVVPNNQPLPKAPEVSIISSQSDPKEAPVEHQDSDLYKPSTEVLGLPGDSAVEVTPASFNTSRGMGKTDAGAEETTVEPAPTQEPAKDYPYPRPRIRSRAEWGANPRLLNWKVEYGHPKGVVVHHTETQGSKASAAQIPQLIANIYYFHSKIRKWGDIGYNVIIDRFGRAWQGRAGDVNRNPIGAHAYGANSQSFGISLLGSYQDERISPAAAETLAQVIAWKASQIGMDPTGLVTYTGHLRGHKTPLTTPAISGHRQVGSTSCPGNQLFAQLPEIRARVKELLRQNSARPFVDVPPTNPFMEEISWMKDKGLSRGWPDGTYRPNSPINRDALVAFLYRLSGAKGSAVDSGFADVSTSNQFAKEITWARNTGISRGWSDNTFRPLAPTQRVAMAAFLHRLCKEHEKMCVHSIRDEVVDRQPQYFVDVPPTNPFYQDIQWMAASGISMGWKTSQGAEFRPESLTNRDAMAAFIQRMVQVKP